MIESQRRLLASLAHPDDESFGPGGTLALYAQQGVAVHLICATRGDVGTVDPALMKEFADVAELREAELDCAAQALGLTEVHQLGYRDSGMPGTVDNDHEQALAAAPLEGVVGQITGIIRRVRPQVVMTFDPIGGYFHPDHVRMHEATLEAFHAAGDPNRFPDLPAPYQPQKLYYHTFPRRWLRWIIKVMPLLRMDPTRWGRNDDIDLTAVTKHDFPIHARIDIREVLESKEMAAACHASQTEEDGSPNFLLRWLRRLGGGQEEYMRAFPPADADVSESDFFEGVRLEESATP